MNRMIMAAATIALFASCNNTATEQPEQKENTAPKITVAQLSTTKDYVCEMDIDRDEMIADTFLYEGKIYPFCDPGCKEEFKKDPQSFLSKNLE